jgi:acyl-CoA synthetase (NDP forming)
MLDLARELGLGVESFVSLGNKADVSGNDLLAAWYDDERVTSVALYLESFGNVSKFARIARRFAQRKPLLAVVGGRSSGGVRAGASHTAAAAAPSVGVDALFAQAGVIGCHSAEDMARAALLLQQQPLPGGGRIAVVSNAGGVGVLAADAADDLGLVVPELSVELRTRLSEHVSGTAGTSNPVDLGAGASALQLSAVVEQVLACGEVDTVIVALVATSVTDPAPHLRALADVRARYPEVPVVLVAMGGLPVSADESKGITVFRTPDDAVEAVAHAVRYAEWLGRPREEDVSDIDEDRAGVARALASELLERASQEPVWLSTNDARDLLAPYGLTPDGVVAHDSLAAAEAATAMGYPVAVKVADEHIVHKTDRGLVQVGLRSSGEVMAAVARFEHELGQDEVPVLVQPLVPGVEVALGVVRDPGFGPLVMVAAGGVATGLLDDRAFLLPPISVRDADRALRSLRIWPMLNGYRGAEPVDTAALQRAVCSLGRLAAEVPEVFELDLNPVMVSPEGARFVDVKVRLAPANPVDAGVPRRLRD